MFPLPGLTRIYVLERSFFSSMTAFSLRNDSISRFYLHLKVDRKSSS